MLGVWFTYRPDEEPLRASIEAWREIDRKNARVAVFADNKSKLVNPSIADFYKETTWERGGNLNGWECVDGILRSIVDACEHFGEEGAVKIDSDTIVSGVSWIDQKSPLCGFCPGIFLICRGLAYWCRKEAAESALESIHSRFTEKSQKYGEDHIITSEMLHLYGDKVKIHHRGQNKQGDFFMSTRWGGRNDPSHFQNAEVVTFGQIPIPSKREVAEGMRKWFYKKELP